MRLMPLMICLEDSYCHLAVELAANRGWTVIPEQSTRLAIKFQWQELNVIIEESVGFIRVAPIISAHVVCDLVKLHNLCHKVMSTVKEAVQKSRQAVNLGMDSLTKHILIWALIAPAKALLPT